MLYTGMHECFYNLGEYETSPYGLVSNIQPHWKNSCILVYSICSSTFLLGRLPKVDLIV